MNILERVGRMCIFGLCGSSMDDPQTRQEIDEFKRLSIRGVILFDHDLADNRPRNIHSPEQLARYITDLRHELGDDAIIAIDQEGGSVSRLDAAHGFVPTRSAAEFARLEEIDRVQYAMKQARQLAKMGINLNFTPCVDLAIEPDSPIIAGKGRSFGVDVQSVSECAQILIDEHRRAGVRCCLKHFPGHGSALLDSHLGVCDVTTTHQDEEVSVYQDLISIYGDRLAIMPGHLMHQRIDPDLPASLSERHIKGTLRDRLGFDGVVITDSLDMRAIRDQFGEVESGILAINAGVDLLLDGLNAAGYRQPGAPGRVIDGIVKAIDQNRIKEIESKLDQSARRVDRLFGFVHRT